MRLTALIRSMPLSEYIVGAVIVLALPAFVLGLAVMHG